MDHRRGHPEALYLLLTVDREIFAELYFCVLNFSTFNFRHLASIYIVDIA